MLGQRRRRWANIRAALVQRLASAGWLVSTVNPTCYSTDLCFSAAQTSRTLAQQLTNYFTF